MRVGFDPVDHPANPYRGETVQWYVVDGKGPQYLRTAAIDDAGTVYVPAAAFGNEQRIMFELAWDGDCPICFERGHIYIPVAAAKKLCQNDRELIECTESLERRIKDAVKDFSNKPV